ncbi:hypothetical protein GCM10022378_11180 [Salinicoccus jeotgali]|uniref:DUF2642 domain-containing protein n=1 Tax=Salinicoccus jeotgali TaxID=381634 RepID=A0ABP7EQK7_9STAP
MNYSAEIQSVLDSNRGVHAYVNGKPLRIKEVINETDDTLLILGNQSRFLINKDRIDYLKLDEPKSGDMPSLKH